MSKTLLAINTLTSVGSQPYASHLNLAFRMGKTGDEFLLFNGWRVSIDRFRNQAAQIALQQDCDYLMFLDDDVLVPKDTYARLKAWDLDVITPVVYIRGFPFKPMFFQGIQTPQGLGLDLFPLDWRESAKEQISSDGLLKVVAVGFSCCLIKVSLLKKIQPAWFVTGTNHTEDVYFCMKATNTLQETGQIPTIGVDTTLNAGHMLDPEFVTEESVNHLREFYRSMDPNLRDPGRGDNRMDYLSKNLEANAKLDVLE